MRLFSNFRLPRSGRRAANGGGTIAARLEATKAAAEMLRITPIGVGDEMLGAASVFSLDAQKRMFACMSASQIATLERLAANAIAAEEERAASAQKVLTSSSTSASSGRDMPRQEAEAGCDAPAAHHARASGAAARPKAYLSGVEVLADGFKIRLEACEAEKLLQLLDPEACPERLSLSRLSRLADQQGWPAPIRGLMVRLAEKQRQPKPAFEGFR